ncbi:FK506-binding protein-like isoform X2 [Petromyzon marinus]|uniref:FK506-binding protein-like isoform X2 n=1 Tax=Petromyzon marinus TaxID=7757 RepID=UPI003F722D67
MQQVFMEEQSTPGEWRCPGGVFTKHEVTPGRGHRRPRDGARCLVRFSLARGAAAGSINPNDRGSRSCSTSPNPGSTNSDSSAGSANPSVTDLADFGSSSTDPDPSCSPGSTSSNLNSSSTDKVTGSISIKPNPQPSSSDADPSSSLDSTDPAPGPRSPCPLFPFALDVWLEVIIGEGDTDVGDALDWCLETMRRGEVCELRLHLSPPRPPPLRVELRGFTHEPEWWQMDAEARWSRALHHKEHGAARFSEGLVRAAAWRYAKALRILLPLRPPRLPADRFRPLAAALYANAAACQLRLGQPRNAVASCGRALELVPGSAKWLHRRATALAQLGELEAARSDLELALSAEPRNAAVHAAMRGVRAREREEATRLGRALSKMFV